jgi:hypothetical protein
MIGVFRGVMDCCDGGARGIAILKENGAIGKRWTKKRNGWIKHNLDPHTRACGGFQGDFSGGGRGGGAAGTGEAATGCVCVFVCVFALRASVCHWTGRICVWLVGWLVGRREYYAFCFLPVDCVSFVCV